MKERNFDKIPEYADLIEIKRWKDAADCGAFIPYDGDGYWATLEGMDRSSDVWRGDSPEWATHVAWFNR